MHLRHQLALIAALCAISSNLRANPDEELQRLFRQHLEERFELHPTMATELGDHRFDARMDDLSAAALKRSQEHLKKSRAALKKAVDRSKLSRDGEIDLEIF